MLLWVYFYTSVFYLLLYFIVDLLHPSSLFFLQLFHFLFVLHKILSNIFVHIYLYLFVEHGYIDTRGYHWWLRVSFGLFDFILEDYRLSEWIRMLFWLFIWDSKFDSWRLDIAKLFGRLFSLNLNQCGIISNNNRIFFECAIYFWNVVLWDFQLFNVHCVVIYW